MNRQQKIYVNFVDFEKAQCAQGEPLENSEALGNSRKAVETHPDLLQELLL